MLRDGSQEQGVTADLRGISLPNGWHARKVSKNMFRGIIHCAARSIDFLKKVPFHRAHLVCSGKHYNLSCAPQQSSLDGFHSTRAAADHHQLFAYTMFQQRPVN
jgi:hypothetical protein